MALANLAVEFKLKGAGEAQRQVSSLGGAFDKLAGTVDRSGGMIRSAWATTLGMLQGNAIQGAINGVAAGMSKLVKLPSDLMQSRYELSKSLGQLAGAGMEVGELRQVEQSAHDYISKWGHTTAEGYTDAFYEIQSSIAFASMKTKKEISEALQTMGLVTQLSSRQAVEMGAKWIHQFGLTTLPQEKMVERIKELAGQFKGAIDVGVFKGPDLMESLKESVPILLEKGWKSSDIFSASAFWQSKGFQGSSTGVALREWGQRFVDATAYAMVGADKYLKGGQRSLDQYIQHPMKAKAEILRAKKLLFQEGFDQAGMQRQMETYKGFLAKLPAYAQHEIRKKGEHEALQPYTKAAFANYEELRRFHQEIENSPYSNLLSKAESANSMFDKLSDRLGNVTKSLMQSGGRALENTWNRALDGIAERLTEIRKHIDENRHSYERMVGAGGRGFWHGLSDIDTQGSLGAISRRGGKYIQALESKNQIDIAMESYALGNAIAKSLAANINTVFGSGGVLDKVGAKFDQAVSSMQMAAGSLSVVSDALLSVAGWFGYKKQPTEAEKWSSSMMEERAVSAEAEKIVDEIREKQQRSDFWSGIKDIIVEAVKTATNVDPRPSDITESREAVLKGPITGTLRIEGNTATLNANAPNNTANAMGQ